MSIISQILSLFLPDPTAKVEANEAKRLLGLAASERPKLVDVRTSGEWKQGRIQGATHIDVSSSEFDRKVGALPREGSYLLYCQSGDASCNASTSMPALHGSKTPILHLHGTNDAAVSPSPTASFHTPVDWNTDWRVFFPMKLWAEQNGCYSSGLTGGKDNGVLRESFTVGSNPASRYDLTGWGSNCSKYQLVLVQNGGHVIGGQHSRIWSFLKSYTLGQVP